MQEDLDRMTVWCEEHGLTLSPSKCKVLHLGSRLQKHPPLFSLGGQTLETAESVRDLGLIVDQRLNFRQHAAVTASKASKTADQHLIKA